MKQKVVAYPIYAETACIIRHRDLIRDYEIVGCSSPKGYGLFGCDSSYADEGNDSNIIVKDVEELLPSADGLLLLPYPNNPEMEFQTRKCVEAFACSNRKIILSTNQCDSWIDGFVQNAVRLSPKYGVPPIYHKDSVQPRASIVLVTGLDENCSKFDVQLCILKGLMQSRLNISYISSRTYGELFGGYSFPAFMVENRYTEIEKIHMFHNFVLNIDRKDHPDIILLGVPGDTISIIPNANHHYGILLYEITRVVRPDYTIFCQHASEYKPDFYQSLRNIISSRFGVSVDSWFMSNIAVNYMNYCPDAPEDKVVYDIRDSKYMEKLRMRHRAISNLYFQTNTQSVTSMIQCMINTLSNYTQNSLLR